MTATWASFAGLLVAAPLLVWMAWQDLRELKISNRNVLLILAIFVLAAPMLDLPEILSRLLAFCLVFAIGLVLFATRIIAGGDVKMLSVVTLLIPSDTVQSFALYLSATLLCMVVILAALQRSQNGLKNRWAALQQIGFPMAPSISLAALLCAIIHLS
ncbi:hypothetical protein EBB79_08970 [Parasedimentitalea marina]|uniref:Prepilin type IV endopeptidase peptidase domain-containing protein n=1 Tax=Parasedimentitalea marina TaxID=2483033 RepID=A0A3T0N1W5_9RHOB|nr:prepilin peptidase [Parasedimentitalea marina]AZV78010.1 hypothetical protein EBB79_08970 [Parasedimentitalea marina]